MVRVEVRTMIYLTAFGRRVCSGLKTPQCAAIAFAALSAGCSADVTRFDSTSFAFDDPPQTARQAPVPPEPVHAQGDYNNPVARSTPRGPYGAGANNVEVAALPDATPSSGGLTEQSWQRSPRGVAAATPAPAYQPAVERGAPAADTTANDTTVTGAIGSGRTIVVQPGDTLYRLSRTHGVSVSELMQANGLNSSDLKPGQRLVVPGSSGASSSAGYEPAQAAATRTAALPVSPDAAQKFNGTYTVKPGDSLYQIARSHSVNYAELQSVNNITDPRRVMPGTVLRVPAGTTVAAVQPSRPTTLTDAPPSVAAPQVEAAAAASPYTAPVNPSVRPAVLNAPQETAAAPKTDKVAVAVPQAETQAAGAAGVDKLRWPVIGRVIGGFGGRPDGTHNDGINISVPLGSDVHAAESGVVAYAGSELKGYGNLILIRHDNGWVTAYAHADELLVKRQDKVRRGQVIAKAGRTGTVDQPQLHFELRQGSRPVDPTPFMERL